jgi:plasmid stabilization system protein ParE
MTYEVVVMPEAQKEMERAYEWLAARTPQHAPEWYNGLLDALYSLEDLPARCPLAQESRHTGGNVRQLLYGDRRHAYRILFEIVGNEVHVHEIRHGARAS